MEKEKRESNRVKMRVPVELQSEGSKGPIRTETADLSLTGFYVEMMFRVLLVRCKFTQRHQLGPIRTETLPHGLLCRNDV